MLKFVRKDGTQIMELKDNDELTFQEKVIEKSFKEKEVEEQDDETKPE